MHQTAYDFVCRAMEAGDVAGRELLEVGSYDVNGSVRPYLESLGPASYLGVDQAVGPRVDKAVNCTDLLAEFGAASYDIVISTEMLEHVSDWRTCMRNLIEVVRPLGLLVITTRSPGFPYHPFPEDNWRYTVEQMGQIIQSAGLEILMLEQDPDPGVFVKARKPLGWASPGADVWADVELSRP